MELGGSIFVSSYCNLLPWVYKFKEDWDTGIIIYWLWFGLEIYWGRDKVDNKEQGISDTEWLANQMRCGVYGVKKEV